MHALKDWLMAGSPPHYFYAIGAALLLVNEIVSWAKLTRAQSLIQALARLVLALPGVKALPVIGYALSKIAGPDAAPEVHPLGAFGKAKEPDVLRLLLVVGLGGMVLAGSGCGSSQLAQAHLGLSTLAQICDAGDKAVTAYDVQLDAEVVAQAQANGDVSAARKRLGDWHVARAKARAIERECLAGVLGYQVALQTYEAKKAGSFDFIAFAQGLSRMAMELVEGLRALGVNVPSLPKFSNVGTAPPGGFYVSADGQLAWGHWEEPAHPTYMNVPSFVDAVPAALFAPGGAL